MLRGKGSKEQLLFDPEIERTIRKNKKQTKKQKSKQKRKGAFTSTSSSDLSKETMAEVINGPCESSPRRFAHLTNNPAARRAKMKAGLLQVIYGIPFAGLDHEDPYTHLTRFYKIAGTLGAPEAEEEVVFMRLF